MSGNHDHPPAGPGYRRVLWLALLINASMFVIEGSAGLAAGSVALQADALDFLGDAATYALTLFVLGMALRWRARAALLKALSMGMFGFWVLGNSVYHLIVPGVPTAEVMTGVGVLALVANLTAALLLYSHRHGDANKNRVEQQAKRPDTEAHENLVDGRNVLDNFADGRGDERGDDESHPFLNPDADDQEYARNIQVTQTPSNRQIQQDQRDRVERDSRPYPGHERMVPVQPKVEILR